MVEVISFIFLNMVLLVGNFFICWIVYCNLSFRMIINFYIVVLVVSDFSLVIFVMLFLLGVLIIGDWIYGNFYCNI